MVEQIAESAHRPRYLGRNAEATIHDFSQVEPGDAPSRAELGFATSRRTAGGVAGIIAVESEADARSIFILGLALPAPSAKERDLDE